VNGAAEYLASLKARIVAHPRVVRWIVVREEAQGDQGLLRYRLMLRGGLPKIPLTLALAPSRGRGHAKKFEHRMIPCKS
jgi:hypothetical protein